MNYFPLLIMLVIAMLNWVAVEKGWKRIEYFAKPMTMIVMLYWLWQVGAFNISTPVFWFAMGAVFSLAGDIFLMLPVDMFLLGLISFLLGHVSYLVGFNTTMPAFGGLGWLFALVVIIVLTVVAWQIYCRLAAGMQAKGTVSLKKPVLIYVIVITLMVISALLCFIRPEWEKGPAALAGLGAIFFFMSDSMLAWTRFIVPISHNRLKVMMLYHLGQFGILVGAAINFLK
jgi:uncharacterized membrane protein YhhN